MSDDEDIEQEEKYLRRQEQLYKILSRNQVVVLPSASIKSVDHLVQFEIFEESLREDSKNNEDK